MLQNAFFCGCSVVVTINSKVRMPNITTIMTTSNDSLKRDSRISLRDVVRGNMESLPLLYGAMLMSNSSEKGMFRL